MLVRQIYRLFGNSAISGGLSAALLFCTCLSAPPAGQTAEQLKLRPGISFSQDIDNGFPIVANKMDDLTIETGRPTFIFFGASGDLNTNRQAKRVVDLYRRVQETPLKFVIVDVDHATSAASKQLIKDYYRGYIPSQVLLDKSGNKVWTQVGEVDHHALQSQVDKVLN